MAEITGEVDVQGLLERIGPLQFRKWQAYFRIKRADEWRIAGEIAAACWNGGIIAKGVTSKEALAEASMFIPSMYLFRLPTNNPQPSDESIQSVLAAAYGPKY